MFRITIDIAIEAIYHESMEKVFDVSSKIFVFALCVLMFCIFANVRFPNEIVNSSFVGIKEMTSFFKAIDIVDFYLFIFSGFSCLVTYIGKKLSLSR